MRHVAVMLTAASPLPLTELMNANFDSGCRLSARSRRSVSLRGRIVLATAAGQSDNSIAQQLDTNRKTVNLCRGRFAQHGLQSLWEVAPGGVLNPCMDRRKFRRLWPPPYKPNPRGGTQWSCRSLAAQQGVSSRR